MFLGRFEASRRLRDSAVLPGMVFGQGHDGMVTSMGSETQLGDSMGFNEQTLVNSMGFYQQTAGFCMVFGHVQSARMGGGSSKDKG